MIFDKQSMFSDAQAITATVASTDIIDLGAPQTPKHGRGPITQDIGRGNPISMRAQVVADFNTLTSLTVTMQVDNDVAFGSPKTVQTTGAIPLVDLKAGKVLALEYIPRGTNERYMRLLYTVAGTNPTLGKVTAGLVFGNEAWSA